MICSISGEVPIDPVVSKISGHVYERRLIEKLVDEEGKCPITGKELSKSDLISLETNKAAKPRPITTMSIPGLISTLQNEYDEVVLESFSLRQALDETRRELTQALYQQDAAERVIARLIRERDEARGQLLSLQQYISTSSSGRPSSSSSTVSPAPQQQQQEDQGSIVVGVSESVLEAIKTKSSELQVQRKGRKHTPEELAGMSLSREALSTLHTPPSQVLTPHRADQGGITAMAVLPAGGGGEGGVGGALLLTAGQDKEIILTDGSSGRVLTRISDAHQKTITSIAFHPLSLANSYQSSSSSSSSSPSSSSSLSNDQEMMIFFTSSLDKTVKIWKQNQEIGSIKPHQGGVHGLSVHPTGQYAVSYSSSSSSTSTDSSSSTWSFLDLEKLSVLTCNTHPSSSSSSSSSDSWVFSSLQIHPDGLLLATGSTSLSSSSSSGLVSIWDLRDSQSKTTLQCEGLFGLGLSSGVGGGVGGGGGGGVTQVCFSENGYHLASGSKDGAVRLWDLRKGKCLATVPFGQSISSLAFDYSGSFLAVGGDQGKIGLYAGKELSSLLQEAQLTHTRTVTGLGFGWGKSSGGKLFSASLDRTLKIHSI